MIATGIQQMEGGGTNPKLLKPLGGWSRAAQGLGRRETSQPSALLMTPLTPLKRRHHRVSLYTLLHPAGAPRGWAGGLRWRLEPRPLGAGRARYGCVRAARGLSW
jgi:hypothetical protein